MSLCAYARVRACVHACVCVFVCLCGREFVSKRVHARACVHACVRTSIMCSSSVVCIPAHACACACVYMTGCRRIAK